MIKLKTKVKIEIDDGEKIIYEGSVESRRLTKKERRTLLEEGQKKIDDGDIVGSHDRMEEVTKRRFELQISGEKEDMDGLVEMCEEYGYSVILAEIDKRVAEQQGKR
jgi:hypothetical protein